MSCNHTCHTFWFDGKLFWSDSVSLLSNVQGSKPINVLVWTLKGTRFDHICNLLSPSSNMN